RHNPPTQVQQGQEQQGQEQQPQNPPSQSTTQTPAAQTGGSDIQPLPPPTDATAAARQAAPPRNGELLQLTFLQALELARKNATQFQAAVTNAGVLHEDAKQARNTLLPTVTYNNSALYTQSIQGAVAPRTTGPEPVVAPPVIYIANNAPHEYISQADIHEAIDMSALGNWRRASAAAAVARAQVEIAKRGLMVTVAQNYYKVGAAQHKLETAKMASGEGDKFFQLTQKLEGGGEVAHADVIKAELQMRDRRRLLQEAELALLNARLDLAVLIFPNFNDNFEVADDIHASAPLPSIEEIQQRGTKDNPDLRAALEAVRQSRYDVFGARMGYLPSLSFDYFYGIDATRFAVNAELGNGKQYSNVGYSWLATLNIPIWNWGTTQSKVKQAELKQAQVKREFSLAQRKLIAEIQSLYAEASTALSELEDLKRSGELASESLRLVTLRYQNGEATVLEVVDAQTTFTTANSAYQDGALRYRVALASLQTLTGISTNP
ncbi:MAG TPA: TolC family protein, partial [Candidatus Eremiobacteraceae bacterium]|nr:TolC family protein [Candidatus Eremiobacteraceae bacterium]